MTEKQLSSINPSNYQFLGDVSISGNQEIEEKVNKARNATKSWTDMGIRNRIESLRAAFKELETRKDEFTLLESREMGMPIRDARLDFDYCIDYANWNFNNAEKYLSPKTTFEDTTQIHQVFYEPIGVLAVIIAWNYPLLNFLSTSLQGLIAGNTIILKHSEECPICGKYIEDIFLRQLPDGVFNEVYGNGEVGEYLVQQNINMISFIGSTKTGKSLYEIAGKRFIKAVMELGGSAPGIIFSDSDIDSAIRDSCNLRLSHAGQNCDGLKRLIVHSDIFDETVAKAATIFSSIKQGNAEDETTEIGPLVAKRQVELLASQVDNAKSKGARVITGGNSLEEQLGGAFFEPTLLTNISPDMRVWHEEVFGPVLPAVSFNTEAEAVELANQTIYGLGAYIFTKDEKQASRVARAIESGMVSINGTDYNAPFNPFGGYKNSGIGREHGKYGFHEVTQIKAIVRDK